MKEEVKEERKRNIPIDVTNVRVTRSVKKIGLRSVCRSTDRDDIDLKPVGQEKSEDTPDDDDDVCVNWQSSFIVLLLLLQFLLSEDVLDECSLALSIPKKFVTLKL